MKLKLLEQNYAVCRCAALGEAGFAGEFVSLTKTEDEVSLVCEERYAPSQSIAEKGWRAMRICGTIEFSEVGVLAKLTSVLADANISIFAVSTYDTDYVLIKAERLEAGRRALTDAGYIFE